MRGTYAARLLAAPVKRPVRPVAVHHWWADAHTWRVIGESAAVVVAAALATAILVRWVLPPLLRAIITPIQDSIGATATLATLPEYLVTTAMRHANRKPSRLAYDYSAAVAGIARQGGTVTGRLLGGLSRGAAKAPPLAVGLAVGAFALAQVLAR